MLHDASNRSVRHALTLSTVRKVERCGFHIKRGRTTELTLLTKMCVMATMAGAKRPNIVGRHLAQLGGGREKGSCEDHL